MGIACIKTGCNAYSAEYDKYYRGDLYQVGTTDVYVLKFNHVSFISAGDRVHVGIWRIDMEYRPSNEGILIFQAKNMQSHGFEGKLIDGHSTS